MADESSVTDADIAQKMARRDEEGLRLFLEKYGGRLMAFLKKKYGGCLQEHELNEALNDAALRIWQAADRFDPAEGSLASWSIQQAQWAALDVMCRETAYRTKHEAFDDPAGDPPEEETVGADGRNRILEIEELLREIEELPTLQKAIIKADLAAGGLADAHRLASIYGTSDNSIFVSRHKARETLRKWAEQRRLGLVDQKR